MFTAAWFALFLARAEFERTERGQTDSAPPAGYLSHHAPNAPNYELWDLCKEFTIEQAAALWAGIEPTRYGPEAPVSTRSLIRENVMNGRLPCIRRTSTGQVLDITGRPRSTDIVRRKHLAKLEAAIADKPRFLFPDEPDLFEDADGQG